MIHLLIFACPKPFVEPFKVIQQNAIKSWKQLQNFSKNVKVDVYLMSDEEGVADYSKKLDCKHINDIKRNKYGTPLVDDIFKHIKNISRNLRSDYQESKIECEVVCCYINSDIIVFNEMLNNIVAFTELKNDPKQPFKVDIPSADPKRFLLIGCRWDTPSVPEIDFEGNWEQSTKHLAHRTGQSHGCWGIDYFIFGPDTFGYVYPFALGKFVWDRWLVGNIFRQDSITVDITNTNFVVHQNGDWYQQSTGGVTSDRKRLFETDEVKINQSFDHYEKDISSGTQYETNLNEEGGVVFTFKENIPRKD